MGIIRMESSILLQAPTAGILASIACGFGALPLSIKKIDFDKNIGLGFAFVGGLMISASVYNLIIPAVTFGLSQSRSKAVFLIITGILLGSLFIWLIEKYLTEDRLERRFIKKIGTRTEILLFIAMSFHSIPEGVAVGVGYASALVLTVSVILAIISPLP